MVVSTRTLCRRQIIMNIGPQERGELNSILSRVPHRAQEALHQRRETERPKLFPGLMVSSSVPYCDRLIHSPWSSEHMHKHQPSKAFSLCKEDASAVRVSEQYKATLCTLSCYRQNLSRMATALFRKKPACPMKQVCATIIRYATSGCAGSM